MQIHYGKISIIMMKAEFTGWLELLFSAVLVGQREAQTAQCHRSGVALPFQPAAQHFRNRSEETKQSSALSSLHAGSSYSHRHKTISHTLQISQCTSTSSPQLVFSQSL